MHQINRNLNFIRETHSCIENNENFQFAKKQALSLYNEKAIYTFIPKNACTTLRASLAIANGVLEASELNQDQNQINWVHNNSYTFSATLPELVKAQYTFIILRCPFDRLFSLFMDKFVDKTKVALDFYQKSNNKFDPDSLTFNQFINYLTENPKIINDNIHWRRQSDFLVYKLYDDYFDFSDFSYIKKTLKNKIGLDIFDTRKITNHGKEIYTTVQNNNDYSDTPVRELKSLKMTNRIPSLHQFITSKNHELISTLYSNDKELYSKHFQV